MIGFIAKIDDLTQENTDFRRVLYSGSRIQLVVMSVGPGQELGGEIHAAADQFFRIESGKGRVMIDGVTHKVEAGDAIVVPGGAHHNLICTGHEPLKLYTIYGPPQHADGLVQKTRTEAEASTETFEGQTTEQASPVVQV